MRQFVIFILSFISISCFAQDVLYSWTKQIESNSFGAVRSVTPDGSGAIYTTGKFFGTKDFDPGPGVLNLTSEGGSDIFITKMDVNGNLLWAKSMGSITNGETAYGLSLSSNGDIQIVGIFYNTVDFDFGPNVVNRTSNGVSDFFILKLNSLGEFIWVKTIGGIGYESAGSITTDSSDNSYVLGRFENTVDFNPGAGTNLITSTGSKDIFIMKLDPSGNILWTKTLGSYNLDTGYSIALNSTGDIYISGSFSGTVDFDLGLGVYELTASNGIDHQFLLKLNQTGDFEWVIRLLDTGGTGVAAINTSQIQIDNLGNVYIPGYCDGEVDVDPGLDTVLVEPIGYRSSFIQKINSNGNFEWVRVLEGGISVHIIDIHLDEFNNIYSTGTFSGTVDFDPGVGEYNYISTGLDNSFVQKMDALGNFEWATYAKGGLSHSRGEKITTDALNNVFVMGNFEDTVDFNPDFGSDTLIATGSYDFFIHKLTQCYTQVVDTVEACNDYVWIDGNTYTTSNATAVHYLTDMQGCDSIVQLNLTINSMDTSLTPVGYSVTSNENGASYQWLNCDDNYASILGEINQEFTATQNGNYAVEIKNGSCVDTSICVLIQPIGFTEYSELNSVVVYPNPTKGEVVVNFGGLNDVFVDVLNTLGQKVYSTEVVSLNQIEFNLPKPKGIYIVVVKANNMSKHYKLIKQ